MRKLFAFAILLMVSIGVATAQSPDARSTGVASPSEAAGSGPSQMDAGKKAWFDQTVGHILGDD